MSRNKRSTEYEKYSTVRIFDSAFSRNLSALIKEKKEQIGKAKLCEELGVTKRTIELWESRQSRPDIDRLPELSEYFKVSLDYLLGLHSCPNPDMDIQGVHEITGLDDEAIESLKRLNNLSKGVEFSLLPIVNQKRLAAINLLIKSELAGHNIFEHVASFLWNDYEALPTVEDSKVIPADDATERVMKKIRVLEKNSGVTYRFDANALSAVSLIRIQEILGDIKREEAAANGDNAPKG